MDLVGPLPKSGRGHEHILVIVDYATRYPEAVSLRKATLKVIANELFLLSSRVGSSSLSLLHGRRENWSCELQSETTRKKENNSNLSHQPPEEMGWKPGPTGGLCAHRTRGCGHQP
ncbi:hypothetical protein QQF64_009624 [Cirrhinus molitorella]|uniref:Uncharacterized protein n=1 Tax=Cirrhinus molitorella TaxID=172907 RepID=A0ABR3M5A1_9TELE